MTPKRIFLLTIAMVMYCQLLAQVKVEYCEFIPSQQQINRYQNQNSPTNQVFRSVQNLSEEEKKYLINLYRDREKFLNFTLNFSRDSIKWAIPVVVHVIRLNNKQGGPTNKKVRDAIAKINSKFAHTKFVFELCKIKSIYSDELYNNYYSLDIDNDDDPKTKISYELLDVKNRNVSQKINMYIFESGKSSWTYSPVKDVNKQHLMIRADHLESDIVMPHEMAHWLDLIHTHGKPNARKELVDGSNCLTAGDFVCDTPADPGLSDFVNKQCQYAPKFPVPRDANGSTYQPDVENIMCYSPRECRNGFSPDQKDRMISAFLTMKNDRGYTLKRCKN